MRGDARFMRRSACPSRLPVLCFPLALLGCRDGASSTVAAPSVGSLPSPSTPASASASISAKPPATEETDRLLPIPARAQAPESPPSGWCGETAIQEGLLHLGVWAPQALINQAGHPSHPDLYSPDMPVALA